MDVPQQAEVPTRHRFRAFTGCETVTDALSTYGAGGRARLAEYIATSACLSSASAEMSGSSADATASPTLGRMNSSWPSMTNGSSKLATTRWATRPAGRPPLSIRIANSSPPRRDRVAGPHAPEKPFGDSNQQRVAGRMTEAVVDEFELVQVQRQHRHRSGIAMLQLHRMCQAVVKQGTVRQAGQRVPQRLIGQR
jgi:hypothetical protein